DMVYFREASVCKYECRIGDGIYNRYLLSPFSKIVLPGGIAYWAVVVYNLERIATDSSVLVLRYH
ncbi:hypothetical protein STEG23_027443, partial [Scotinomys teguina]